MCFMCNTGHLSVNEDHFLQKRKKHKLLLIVSSSKQNVPCLDLLCIACFDATGDS